MPSLRGRKQRAKSKLSMKDALADIGNAHIDIKPKKSWSLRDFIWEYPLYISSAFVKLIPLSYIVLFVGVAVLMLFVLQSKSFVTVVRGSGEKETFREGAVGAFSSFNPLFSTNNYVDRSIQSLVFEKFVDIDKDGNPIPSIAVSWKISSDNLRYEFTIADDKVWHDGTSLTVDDVLFTFKTAIELADDYDTIGTSIREIKIEKVDERTVAFILPEVNPVFFYAISVYIVPEARFRNVELNQILFNAFTKYPMGSGKYEVVRTDDNAVYLKDNVHDGYEPAIKNLVFKVYPDVKSLEMAFRVGSLDAIGGWDNELFTFVNEYKGLNEYEKADEYRRRLVFFNIRKDSLKEKAMRQALTYLFDKDTLLKEFGAKVLPIGGPIPKDSWAYNSSIDYYSYNFEKATELLKGLGYVKNDESGYFESSTGEILSFTLSYFDSLTNERLIPLIVENYKRNGIVLKVEKLNYVQLTQEIIATRDFELLLYEIETTIDPDQYNLWHSLKGNYPDWNLSGYSYERVDILLEDGRKTLDQSVRKQKYNLFQKYLMADCPAMFIYSPVFTYYVKDGWSGIDMSDISYSYERFSNIEQWKYIK